MSRELTYLEKIALEYIEEVARNWKEPTDEARSLANHILREIGIGQL